MKQINLNKKSLLIFPEKKFILKYFEKLFNKEKIYI